MLRFLTNDFLRPRLVREIDAGVQPGALGLGEGGHVCEVLAITEQCEEGGEEHVAQAVKGSGARVGDGLEFGDEQAHGGI